MEEEPLTPLTRAGVNGGEIRGKKRNAREQRGENAEKAASHIQIPSTWRDEDLSSVFYFAKPLDRRSVRPFVHSSVRPSVPAVRYSAHHRAERVATISAQLVRACVREQASERMSARAKRSRKLIRG